MSDVVEAVLRHNRAYAATFRPAHGSAVPAKGLAVITCMDVRIDVLAALGLAVGDAHIIRNAGAVVTEDVIRSLVVSQRLLGTKEVVLVAHTECGMATFTEGSLKDEIEAETGERPSFSFETFSDPDSAIRRGVERLRNDPIVPHREALRGFVYDVATGSLREVPV